MQQKIDPSASQDIKIFAGSPPSTNWVNENISQYVQIQSETDLLNDVLNYVQELQSEQLQKARGHVKPFFAKEAFVPIPDKGTAEDIGNRATYNAMQGSVKTQMEFMENMILVLKRGKPDFTPQLDSMLKDLHQMGKSFPRLAPQQVEHLNQMMSQLVGLAGQVPPSYQRIFWNTQLIMLQNLMSDNGSNIKGFTAEANELHARSQMLASLGELLENIQTALKATPPNPEQFLQLIENLQSLGNKNPLLNPVQSQHLQNFFQQLLKFTNTKGENLSHLVADVLVHDKMNTFLKENPKATASQVVSFLRDFLKHSNLQKSPLALMHDLGDSIEELINKPDFPVCNGYSGMPFASLMHGKIQPNDQLFTAILARYAPSEAGVKNLKTAADQFLSSVNEEIADNNVKREGFQKVTLKLSEVQNILGKGSLWTVGQSLLAGMPVRGSKADTAGRGAVDSGDANEDVTGGSDSSDPNLPLGFQHAIIDHYMPGQEQYLEMLAMMLELDNFGAMFGNQLLQDMLGWAGAAYEFDFSNWLHQAGDGNFSGSATQAQHQLSSEKTACSNAINQAKKAETAIKKQQNLIKSEITKIQNSNLPAAEKSKLINGLQQQSKSLSTLLQNIKSTLSSLTTLQNLLGQLTINNVPGETGKEFSVSGPSNWQSQLSHDESDVVNGDPSLDPPGGMVNCSTLANSFQQTWSDQSQDQQLILQLNMTEIQQEWTVVSTAMQILNQIYMSVAQQISK